ncbi:hypothetical protein E2C01_067453 [Portunus trituberculatus]|uniref:Uncharacterized protein n=1 Tax=Portunus trituberculatus TaxID=210409 RepID=A0A5B7HXH3_PORTR|nr:hypothetical protein [Portunus trituberculatus]
MHKATPFLRTSAAAREINNAPGTAGHVYNDHFAIMTAHNDRRGTTRGGTNLRFMQFITPKLLDGTDAGERPIGDARGTLGHCSGTSPSLPVQLQTIIMYCSCERSPPTLSLLTPRSLVASSDDMSVSASPDCLVVCSPLILDSHIAPRLSVPHPASSHFPRHSSSSRLSKSGLVTLEHGEGFSQQ